ncbi:ADP-dependent glucokinase/phosphofructokinase [Methanosarcina sp. Z-7115]|uniref:ADP-dependent glucokinase/phosphofructokinase n=1 Tax=Methanosarcina baikalica TaxID=3073890 RepID=A0ABU2CX68_9EURY|nr:ADP-dependent glucokinase/phosphofructokinase [Methanosarcina sp. Z-7115]MDR7664330.1 ADP-dependent glucokinase/phosphofructokinase [Methanosarcina sp. Z-7115]
MNILCEYNVNIDSVYRVSGAEVSELLETFEKAEILEKIENPPGKILSESDFVAGLAYCMKNGCGAEWLVFEQSIFEFLKNRYFEKSLVRMGGNAGIMANALSQLGASRVIPNVAVPSKTQLSLFSEKAIYFPAPIQIKENSGGEPDKNTDIVSGSPEPIHFVFDFSVGDTFSLYGIEVRVPRENRFIATCDHLNLRLFVNPAFERYALQHVCEIDGVLISGFHLLLESYPDGSSYKMILENSLSQLRRWKAANNKLRIHLEFGHFASKEIANSVFLDFAAISDSIGMNEDELSMLHHLHGIPVEDLLRMEAEAVGNAACRLASRYGLKKLLIHTREFALTVFKPDFNLNSKPESKSESKSESNSESKPNPENSRDLRVSEDLEDLKSSILQKMAGKKLEALRFGVRCAGAYAASGRLEGREFVEEEASKLHESLFGREQLELFLKAFHGVTFGQGAYAFREGYVICMIPTLLSGSPITTVGLGDTLTAGTFLRGLELDVQT